MVSLYNYIQKTAIAPDYLYGTIEPGLVPLSEMAGEYRTFSLELSWYIQKFTKFVTVKISADQFYHIVVFIA